MEAGSCPICFVAFAAGDRAAWHEVDHKHQRVTPHTAGLSGYSPSTAGRDVSKSTAVSAV